MTRSIRLSILSLECIEMLPTGPPYVFGPRVHNMFLNPGVKDDPVVVRVEPGITQRLSWHC